MLTRLVWGEKSILRDVAIGSITVTILSVLPALMIMTTLNTVVMYQSINTLTLIVTILMIALGFEMLITWSRRMLLVILASRLDTRLNLAIFDRLMTLPIDFFERNQAGELSYKIAQLYRVREFLTGRMTTTFIDVIDGSAVAARAVLHGGDARLDRADRRRLHSARHRGLPRADSRA